MSGSGQDPRAPGGWPQGGDPRSSQTPPAPGWPPPPPQSTGGWRDPRTGQWVGGETTGSYGPPGSGGYPQSGTEAYQRPGTGSYQQPGAVPPSAWQDPGTGQWQVTGTGAWGGGGVPGGPVQPHGAPPPPPRRGGAPLFAPLVALLGLVLVAGGSVFAASRLDLVGGGTAAATPTAETTQDPGESYDPNATETPGPPATPTPQPTAFVTPPPNEQATVPGTLLYVRDGNIWSVTGTASTQLTGKGSDSSPTWSEDGQSIYFVRTTLQRGKTPPWGNSRTPPSVTHYATDIMSMTADGGAAKRLFTSMFRSGQGFWSTVAIQPDLSPDGKTFALVSDFGEVPTSDIDATPVILATMSSSGKNLKDMGIRYEGQGLYTPLGHNDPAWSPDGKSIAFTYDDKGGGKGAGIPHIGIIKAPFKKRAPELSPNGRGYANPSWSPDGRYIAAERMTNNSRDIVVLDPNTWAEVARLTTDGKSFAPEWSPSGDQIAFLHVDGLDVDARVMTLDLAGNLTLTANQAVTVDGSVDPESPPAWFMPADQRVALPTPTPGPLVTDAPATPDAAATDGASAAP